MTESNSSDPAPHGEFLNWIGATFRPELAFPKLSEDMVYRLRAYGGEETVPTDTCIYSHGDRNVDLFIVLEGGVDIILPGALSGTKIYNQIRTYNFTGELNLLNSQGVAVEAMTIAPSLLLRIPRSRFKELMRNEGDIANLIVLACLWRRLRIAEAALSGVVLKGRADDPQMMLLRRFLLRNIYPHRVVEIPADGPANDETLENHPVITLPDGRTLEQPEIPALADELGITELPDSKAIFDVAVVGAEPNTGWLCGTVQLDNKGFVLTNSQDGSENGPYATSMPGIYAVGDVRANSVKRVASAVGEGSVVISYVHCYLAAHRDDFRTTPESTLPALRNAHAPAHQ